MVCKDLGKSIYFGAVFAENLNEIWHREVHDAIFPRQLQDDVRMQQIVAMEKTSRKTVVLPIVKEIN